MGSFAGFPNIADLVVSTPATGQGNQATLRQSCSGLRICANPECREIVFVTVQGGNVISYPAERLDFEPTDIPPKILVRFEEAIIDHANRCFRSAAIMVRRTLEEICAEQHATGPNLKERLKALGSLIVVPKELLEAADELRLLGNDAAHLDVAERLGATTYLDEMRLMAL